MILSLRLHTSKEPIFPKSCVTERKIRSENSITVEGMIWQFIFSSSFLSLCSSWMVQMREVGSNDAFGQYVVDNDVDLGTNNIGKNSVGSKE